MCFNVCTNYFFSTLVYPVPNQTDLDEAHPELNKGKYEPIGLMNGLLREKINQFMLSVSGHSEILNNYIFFTYA